jgi:class 3 adenylate cyclase
MTDNNSTRLSKYENNDYEEGRDRYTEDNNNKDNDLHSQEIQDSANIRIDDGNPKNDNEQINFINFTQVYCVGFIDIVDSTRTTAKIHDPKKLRKYYSLFLNSLSPVIHQSNGKIVKNSGDNLFFYFPKTSNINSESALKDAFDCVELMKRSRIQLNTELRQEDLPEINFRISMDYGMVEVALSSYKNEVDLFGPVVNNCAKMNRLSNANNLVIGERLYEILAGSSLSADYEIKQREPPIPETNDIGYNVYFVSKKSPASNTTSWSDLNEDKLISKSNSCEASFTIKKGRPNILIVDDEEDILYAYNSLLKMNGYEVHMYSNPAQALKHLMDASAPHGYDLVITDIRMPDINGIKLFYWLKAMDPFMNILFVSALDIIDEFVGSLPGFDTNDIIKKPISNADFISKVEEKLTKW